MHEDEGGSWRAQPVRVQGENDALQQRTQPAGAARPPAPTRTPQRPGAQAPSTKSARDPDARPPTPYEYCTDN